MRKLLAALICAAVFPAAASAPAMAQSPVLIRVDLTRTLGSYKPITSWFGYDEANYTTMKYGRQLLAELHDLSPVPVHIRAHHLFTSGNGVPELKWSSTNVFSLDGQGRPVYDFAIIDRIFDAYKRAGVRPMVELGFMPKDLSAKPDPYQVHFPGGNPTAGGSNEPPKDYVLWGELVRKFTEHLVQRYGAQETRTWYWEVWNEPDIFYWHGTRQDYFKLYDYAAAGVRAALPGAMVGGPATTGPGDKNAAAFLEEFLKHCATERSAADGKAVPLSFISFHAKGQPTMADGHVRMGLDKELTSVAEGFRIVRSNPKFDKLPIILSEADPEGCAACSAKMNPANAYRNGPLYAAYTASALKGFFELQDRYKVNLISMLSWSFEFEDRDYFEGFRSLATNGIDKPILNLFRMTGLMSGSRVWSSSTSAVPLDDIVKFGVRQTPDIDVLATKGDRQAALLVWNYHDDDVPAEASDVKVTIDGMPVGVRRVLLSHYRIDDRHSNAYTVWKDMGSPQTPSAEQYARLKASDGLQLLESPRWLDVEAGTVTLTMLLPRQATSLLQITW
jgi:xylan 1,4-beta-xylosidase